MRLSITPTRLAIITGASSGIGKATASSLAREGFSTVLIARRKDHLNKVAEEIRHDGGSAIVIPADISNESERLHAFSQILELNQKISVLVNNAGIGWYGFASQMPWQVAIEMLQVNIVAAAHFTFMCLQNMLEQGKGHIINIGSISGALPSQGIALYGATKSFLDNFSSALYRESRGSKIHVSMVRAGPVLTDFCKTAASLPSGRSVPTEKIGIHADKIGQVVVKLIRKPRRLVYIPKWLAVTPWLEAGFGWLIDLLGPLLLNRT